MTEPTFVFVGGLHRSGTTPLARVLASHRDVSALSGTGVPMDEGQHLQSVYATARALGGPGAFGFASGGHLTENSTTTPARDREALLDAWSPHWDLTSAVLLEKSPPNLIRMRFLQALFPDARFVVIVRHPIPTAIATQKWTDAPVDRLVQHWTICHELLLHDAAHVGYLRLVRYEDFVANPSSELESLARLLELSPDFDAGSIVGDLNDRYLDRWDRDSWSRDPRAVEVARVLGYSFDEPQTLTDFTTPFNSPSAAQL